MANLFNLGHTWSLKKEAQKIELQIFFRGLGGTQDCALVMAKLAKARMLPIQMVMVEGIDFGNNEPLGCYGEASLGLTYYSMEPIKDLSKILAVLFNCKGDTDYSKKSWINDYDQYSKIQVRSKVDSEDWSRWIDYNEYTDLLEAA